MPLKTHTNHSLPFFCLFIVLCLITACSFFQEQEKINIRGEKPIARVFDRYLYPSDLELISNRKFSTTDSTDLVTYEVDNWIRRHLLLQQATTLIPDAEAIIQKQVSNYKESLLIYLYEQELLKINSDTAARSAEIQDYYLENKENFQLEDHLLRVRFVIWPKDSPKWEEVRTWFKEATAASNKDLHDYCFQYSSSFALDEQWYLLGDLKKDIPLPINSDARNLPRKEFFELSDSLHHFLVEVKQSTRKGTLAPLDYKRHDIAKIIVNKRKLQYIKEMKDQIYQAALNNNDVEIF